MMRNIQLWNARLKKKEKDLSYLQWSSFWPGCDLHQVLLLLILHPVQMSSLGAWEWAVCCLAYRSHTTLHSKGTKAKMSGYTDILCYCVTTLCFHVKTCYIYCTVSQIWDTLTFIVCSDWLQPPHWFLTVWKPIKVLVLSIEKLKSVSLNGQTTATWNSNCFLILTLISDWYPFSNLIKGEQVLSSDLTWEFCRKKEVLWYTYKLQ